MMIRVLDPVQDADKVLDLYCRAADYIWLETGRSPDASLVAEYFVDAPPGGDPATSLKLGLFEHDLLIGLADLAFGFPESHDAYVGRMMLAHEARGKGLGTQFLCYLEETARRRSATRLLLSVLETNLRGRSFWEREGFAHPVMIYPRVTIGKRSDAWIRLEKQL